MPTIQGHPHPAKSAAAGDLIDAIRSTANDLNLAVLESVIKTAEAFAPAAAARELQALGERIGAATDALSTQLGEGGADSRTD